MQKIPYVLIICKIFSAICVICDTNNPESEGTVYSRQAKRQEILYKNFVADCKVKSTVCLHAIEIESIDLQNLKTYKLKTHVFADTLKIPNRPWLRSF